MRSRLIGQQSRSARAQVAVAVIQVFLVGRRKVIADQNGGAFVCELQFGVTVIASAGRRVERSIAGRHVNISLYVGGRSSVTCPNSALSAIGGHVESRFLGQRCWIVCHHPAVIRTNVAGRSPGEIERGLGQQQGCARVLEQWIEVYSTVLRSPASSGYRSHDGPRPAKFLHARGD